MCAVVSDMRILKAMARRGFVIPHKHWGMLTKHWTGAYVKAFYIQGDGPKAEAGGYFEYKGIRYRTKYFDGCFYPFVVRADANNLPAFV